ncbi:ATP-binding protein [Patescibacteria group bacterium]|nr:ATP-binding protein [Patescibacteria group bacterium]
MENNWIGLQLPEWKHIGRYLIWGSGRVTFSLWLFGLNSIKSTLKVGIVLTEMTERSTHHLLSVYGQLPHMGILREHAIDVTATSINSDPSDIIIDLVKALEGKHSLIIGDTGTGKSSIAQWISYQVGGEVKIYDPDAAPDDWNGLTVIGRRGNFAAIADAMAADLVELQRRIEVRGELGDRALAGLDSVLIAEEFPLLRDEIPVAVEWLTKHARRGRKPKRMIIALAQDDQVKTLGIEGEGGVRKNFRMVRLGKFAVSHAKSLKNNHLIEWLKAGKYRCMVDDEPCQLPDISSFRMVLPRLQPVQDTAAGKTAETPTESALQPVVTNSDRDMEAVAKAVKACLEAGLMSETKVIKEILGYQGARYQEGKVLLMSLKQEYGF